MKAVASFKAFCCSTLLSVFVEASGQLKDFMCLLSVNKLTPSSREIRLNMYPNV